MKPEDAKKLCSDLIQADTEDEVIKILKDANYQGWFTLEFEAKEDPFVAVPRILAEVKPLLG